MKNILVTGATGFIGNYVVSELIQRGYNVICTSAHTSKAKLREWYDKVKYIEFDIKLYDPGCNYFNFFQNPEAVIHLAWEGLPNYKDQFHITENLPRHYLFLENLIKNGLKNLTISGTCLEYGMQEGRLHEELASMPVTSYAIAKNELRKQLLELSLHHNFYLKWVRLFYTFGDGQNPDSLISQLNKAILEKRPFFNMSGGEQVRDYLPVQKLAENIVSLSLKNNVTGIINCCSGIPISVRDFVNTYLSKKNENIDLNYGFYPYTDYEPMNFWGDTKKLNAALIS